MAFAQPPEVININDDDDSDGFQEVRPKRKKTRPRKKSGSLCNFLSPHAYTGDSNSSSGTSQSASDSPDHKMPARKPGPDFS